MPPLSCEGNREKPVSSRRRGVTSGVNGCVMVIIVAPMHALLETTCFKSGKTNSLEEQNTFLRSAGRRNTSQSEQLNILLAPAMARFHYYLFWRRVRLHSCYAQNLPKYTRHIFAPPFISARVIIIRAQKYGVTIYSIHVYYNYSLIDSSINNRLAVILSDYRFVRNIIDYFFNFYFFNNILILTRLSTSKHSNTPCLRHIDVVFIGQLKLVNSFSNLALLQLFYK